MKKTLFLGIITFLFFSFGISKVFAQTKWTDFVGKIPEISLPYEFDQSKLDNATKLDVKDVTTHFKVKRNLSDMWSAKVLGKITAPNGAVAIIWSKDDLPKPSVTQFVSFFDKKGKEKELKIIILYAGYGNKNDFSIKKEESNYIFEEIYKKSGKVVGKVLRFNTNPKDWEK